MPTLVISCRMLGASKGCLNVSISYSTHPSDHTSLCSSSAHVTGNHKCQQAAHMVYNSTPETE